MPAGAVPAFIAGAVILGHGAAGSSSLGQDPAAPDLAGAPRDLAVGIVLATALWMLLTRIYAARELQAPLVASAVLFASCFR